MDFLKDYPPGTVLLIILCVFLLIGQIAGAWQSIKAAKKDADKPMEDLRGIEADHTNRLGSLERDVADIKADLKEIHAKDTKREHDEKAEQRAILALLNHALTGNNEHEMQTAKDDLNEVVWGGDNNING